MSSQPCLPVSKRQKLDGSGEKVTFDDVQSLNADEYLSRVVREANRLPDVFVASSVTQPLKNLEKRRSSQSNPPIEGCATSLSYLVSRHSQLCPAPSSDYLPANPRAWVSSTLDNFSRLRDYLDQCRQQGIGSKDAIINRLPLPPLKDRAAWHTFCVGVQDAQGNEGSYFDHDEKDEEKEDGQSNGGSGNLLTPAWKVNLPENGFWPEVSLLLQMDQVMVRKVLSHLAFYVSEGWSSTNHQRSAWIYALLARLERPLHRDDACTLFGLLKQLLKVRHDLKLGAPNSRENLARMNVLIAIVGVYFEQGGFQSVMTTEETFSDLGS